ncbi:MAG: DUF5688 family protein [Lachnospiraceae bacterium]|nr:DUF5688 family protein [Lachnospiraceae bacterium]
MKRDVKTSEPVNFDQFKNEFKGTVDKLMGNTGCSQIITVKKTNRGPVQALIVIQSQGKISPVFYIDEVFQEYQQGISIQQLAEKAVSVQMENQAALLDINVFLDYEKAREQIFCRIIGTIQNQEYLENIPHTDFLDMSVTYHYVINDRYSILINNEHIQQWGISDRHLHETACRNMRRRKPYRLASMAGILKDALHLPIGSEAVGKPEEAGPEMYVLTNDQMDHAAVNIIFGDVLSEIAAKIGGDFYLLPSSIHECIVLPVSSAAGGEAESLKSIVSEINENYVDAAEVLTSSVYRYICSNEKLVIAA